MAYKLKEFKDPQREYSIAPFWFWNCDLSKEEIERQLQEMNEKGVYECVLHARKGMQMQYLSEEWFNRVYIALLTAEKLGMRIWIYDENNWPSGYADGGVVLKNPEFTAKCLSREKLYPVIGKDIVVKNIPGKRIVSVIAAHKNEEFFDITDIVCSPNGKWHCETLQWEVHVFREEECTLTPAYCDSIYVDVLNPKATDCFISLTHAEYKKRFPQYFGNVIKGFFVDEPGLYQNYFWHSRNINTIAWTPLFPQWFLKRYGYDIMPYCCMLWEDMGELTRKIRHDYYEAISLIYRENFFDRIHDFCKKNNVLLIGHSPREEFMHETITMAGHFFRTMDDLDVPGIDRIDRERIRVTERLGSSAAHLYGKKRCFSETYGCFGWELTPQEMKSEADWQYVQGVNMMIPHAFFASIEGFRLTESPPSLFEQNIYWSQFKLYADYMRRLSYILSAGKPLMDALLYYPMTSVWEKYLPIDRIEAQLIDRAFIEVSDTLFKSRICFDIADDMPFTKAKISAGKIEIEGIRYGAVVLPPIWNIPLKTLRILETFLACGGKLISIGKIPERGIYAEEDVDVRKIVERISSDKNYFSIQLHEIARLEKLICDRQIILCNAGEGVFTYAATDGKNKLYFIVNQSEEPFWGTCIINGEGNAEIWNAEDGTVKSCESCAQNGKTMVNLHLGTNTSAILMLRQNSKREILKGEWTITLEDGQRHILPLRDIGAITESPYSGKVIYEKEFYLKKRLHRAILKLGKICDFASVELNHRIVGSKLWTPFDFDIGDFLVSGKNYLKIVVGNTLSNKINQTRLPVGLIGPVGIYME